jgi:hypothetical protein
MKERKFLIVVQSLIPLLTVKSADYRIAKNSNIQMEFRDEFQKVL